MKSQAGRHPRSGQAVQPDTKALVALFQAGRYADVEVKARSLLAKHPQSGFLWKALGTALQVQGKNALPALEQACRFAPADAELHNSLGLALRGAARGAEALSSFRKSLALNPANADALSNLGMSLLDAGSAADAIVALRQALAINPRHAQGCNNLGNALMRQHQAAEAAQYYSQAIALVPQYAEAYCNLGKALRDLGRVLEAIECCKEALVRKPDYVEAHANLAALLLETGKLDLAESSCRQALALKPNSAQALNNLGLILREQGRPAAAAASFRAAVAAAADVAEAWNNLGGVLCDLGQIDDGLACCNQALALQPGFAEAHVNLGQLHRLAGKLEQARADCIAALQLDPQSVPALLLVAELHIDQGRFAEAEQAFLQIAEVDPSCIEAWAGIPRVRKMTAADGDWLQQVQGLLQKGMAPRRETQMRFAVGKYHDDVRDFDSAFHHYRLANESAKRGSPGYDAGREMAQLERIRQMDAAWIAGQQMHGNPSARPVFIVGMPRSGTSLAEQILAAHPQVCGAGELMFWPVHAPHLAAGDASTAPAALSGLAAAYLDVLNGMSPEAARVVDKMPGNFRYLGWLHAAFPRARIIHMKRDPVDTCLSIYFQYFGSRHPYSNDPHDLAHYYRAYLAMMEHWRKVLPASALFEVSYEDLVAAPETWSRRMVDFIGLPWDERCLDFDRAEHAVRTASSWQVRQKIHQASAGRWRNYAAFVEPWLPLLDTEKTGLPRAERAGFAGGSVERA